MVRSIQRWGPNTCGCKMFQEHGDGQPVEYRTRPEAQAIVNTISGKIQPAAFLCPAHEALGHTAAMYAAVLAENQTWNVTFSILIGFLADATVQQYRQATDDGAGQIAYDANRVLQVDTSRLALTGRDRMDLQDAVNLQFGPDKVLIF